ncbi:hypothetical protein PHYSODRAFT_318751 [Phytophthora sojae]|uniref:Cyclic nucleotide-binding domain-containing protein n=1 Tax=Phytophthora sojae (strain P6497) TaxID=1094619 RepID=G5A6C4_PHYSP|nr:hypothetical protein PHYSODRAFT_318751 [Phytophthora sojae]EGZ08879.1 hypothetical protein PHYSODRAFT_318751 [Phytophthora sojae]|eukprot:XP_009535512.1 hypothetical protein PHYSODRAFT_318751 [Phytophthora sojae]
MFTALCTTIFIISKCESGQTEAMDACINQLIHVLSFHRRYYTDSQSNDREASRLLCPSIASDIQVELLRPMIAQMTVFSECSDQFIIAVAGLLEMIALPSQTTLFSAGDYGDALYIVHSGVLEIIVDSVTVRDIRKGSCFGELSVFSSMPRTATVRFTATGCSKGPRRVRL